MGRKLYTSQLRKQWVLDNLDIIEHQGWTYKDIKKAIHAKFDLDSGISDRTIQRDLAWARQKRDGTGLSEAEEESLHPDNFPKWRLDVFGYVTSKTQHALYWVMRGLALKEDIPDWVIEHFDLPETVNEDVQEKEKLMTFILLVAPRHGKTMTMVHGLIHLYCDNPDLRVVYCQGIATTTNDINKLIMLEMEDNDKLKPYGPFKGEDRQWSGDNGFILAKRKRHSITPSFLPVGITSNVRSRDADIIIIDDPQDETRAESEATTQKDYNKIVGEFMSRREPHTPVLGVGSHVATLFGDVWTQLEDNMDDIRTEGQELIIRKRPVHDDENCKVFAGEAEEHWDCLEWPEFRDWNFIMAQRAMMGDDLFQAVYQQDNKVEGTRPFEPERVKTERKDGGILDPLRNWKEPLKKCMTEGCKGTLYGGMGFDPAAGEGRKASYTAIAFLQGCNVCNTLYVVDYEQRRVSPDMHPGMVDAWTDSFKHYLHMLRIEINAYQKALARNEQVRDASRRNKFMLDEWNTDDRKNSPEFGIPLLANYVRDGKFSAPAKSDIDREYGREFEKALIRYPKKPNDIPMAVWLAAGAVWMLWELYEDNAPIYLRGREDNTPQYMVDQPLTIDLGALRDLDPDSEDTHFVLG